jgi:hypothetical protein
MLFWHAVLQADFVMALRAGKGIEFGQFGSAFCARTQNMLYLLIVS